jgi:hypothetical protein
MSKRFVVFVIDSASNTGTDSEMKHINAFNQGLVENEQLILAVGIASPADAKLFDFRDEKQSIGLGSLNPSNRFYSGFWIISAKDATEAEDIAARASNACNREVELRPLLG